MPTLSKTILFIPLMLLFCSSCKKEKKGCWQAYSEFGEVITGLEVCDKTKQEAEDSQPYRFANTEETKYCWRVQPPGSNIYNMGDIPQSITDGISAKYGYVYTKVPCNSFCTWELVEKRKSKITNTYSPSRSLLETFTTDTCSKLFVGKLVIYNETADSIITREFNTKRW
jgi:hypothetical protein